MGSTSCYLPSSFPLNLALQDVGSLGFVFVAFSAISSARLKNKRQVSPFNSEFLKSTFPPSLFHISTVPNRGVSQLIVLGINDTSTLVGHFVSSQRKEEKRKDSRGDEIEGRGRKLLLLSCCLTTRQPWWVILCRLPEKGEKGQKS